MFVPHATKIYLDGTHSREFIWSTATLGAWGPPHITDVSKRFREAVGLAKDRR